MATELCQWYWSVYVLLWGWLSCDGPIHQPISTSWRLCLDLLSVAWLVTHSSISYPMYVYWDYPSVGIYMVTNGYCQGAKQIAINCIPMVVSTANTYYCWWPCFAAGFRPSQWSWSWARPFRNRNLRLEDAAHLYCHMVLLQPAGRSGQSFQNGIFRCDIRHYLYISNELTTWRWIMDTR